MNNLTGIRVGGDHKTKVLDQIGADDRHYDAEEVGPESGEIIQEDNVSEGGIETESPSLQYISQG
jgi:hypothetical protein